MKRRVLAATTQMFRSLSVRDFRLYWAGMTVSVCGTWMQYVAQDWLVIELGGRGAALGAVTGLQFLPLLLAGPWGGAVADRVDKRRLLLVTQATLGALAGVLGLLTLFDAVAIWTVLLFAFLVGCASVLDIPARHALVSELVPPEHLPNAIALNGLVFNAARIVGPALAALTISAVGVAPAFLVNAGSYAGPVLALAALSRSGPVWTRVARRRGEVREGLRYAWRTPSLRFTLLLMATVSMFGLNYRVLLPVIARFALDGGPGTYGALAVVMAAGAVGGTLGMAATRAMPTRRWIATFATVFGVLSMSTAVAPTLPTMMVLLFATGAASITFLAASNSLLQLESEPAMRGRVIALYALVFVGSNPIGAPVVGWASEQWGVRTAMFAGGAVTTVAGVVAAVVLVRAGRRVDAPMPGVEPEPERDAVGMPEAAAVGAGGA